MGVLDGVKNMLNTIEKMYKMSIVQKKKITECLSDHALDWPECPEQEFDLKQLVWKSDSLIELQKKNETK